MNLGLSGKRALVTAASSGLGYASAAALAAEGARVALCSRDPARAEAAAERIAAATGATVLPFACDVADDASLRALFEQATAALGGLELLICNAGGPPAGGFETLEEAQWEFAYRLTLLSVARSVRYALPHLRTAGGGRVLAIASSSVKRPLPNLLLSNVFRPAVQGLIKSLSIELAADNVALNCLAPGRIHTDRVDQLDRALAERQGSSFDEVRARAVAAIPMGRLGTPEEFGRVAAFLLSEAASYISGSTILVDGGAVRCL